MTHTQRALLLILAWHVRRASDALVAVAPTPERFASAISLAILSGCARRKAIGPRQLEAGK